MARRRKDRLCGRSGRRVPEHATRPPLAPDNDIRSDQSVTRLRSSGDRRTGSARADSKVQARMNDFAHSIAAPRSSARPTPKLIGIVALSLRIS